MKLRVERKLLRSTRRGNIFEKWFSCDPCTRMMIVDSESAFTSIRFVFDVDVSLIEKSRDVSTVSCHLFRIRLFVYGFSRFIHDCTTVRRDCLFPAFVSSRSIFITSFVAVFFFFFQHAYEIIFFRDTYYYTFATKYPRSLEICVSFVDFHRFVSHYLRAIVHACNRFPCVNRNSCRLIWINRLFRDLLVVLGRFMLSVLWQPDLFFISCLIFTRFYFIAGDVHKQ